MGRKSHCDVGLGRFGTGEIIASLKQEGTTPLEKERFSSEVTHGESALA